MKDRKIIFKSFKGSHLYGTNHAKSDHDYGGVFLNSASDLLGLEKRPDLWNNSIKVSTTVKNSKDDVDDELKSLPNFLYLCATGDSGCIESLFTPKEKTLVHTEEWDLILKNRDWLVTQKIRRPFLDYSKAQAYKAVSKVTNLNLLKEFVDFFSTQNPRLRIRDVFPESLKNKIEMKTLTDGVLAFELGGKTHLMSLKVSQFLKVISQQYNQFGHRVQSASQVGYDAKSLAHAYRTLFEAEELLTTGYLTLPLPEDKITFLKSVLNREFVPDTNFSHYNEYSEKVKALNNNLLPESVDMGKLNKLCESIMFDYFKVK